MEETKKCPDCKETKSIMEFYKTIKALPLSKNNSTGYCKPCTLKRGMDRAAKLKETNSYKIILEKECDNCHSIKPVEEFAKHARTNTGYYNLCYVCNRERQRTLEYRTVVNATVKDRRETDPDFVLKADMRAMLKRVYDKIGTKKEGHTADILGYSPLDLKLHLESQFLPGMTWENKGLWHIDHIISISWCIEHGITDPSLINCLANLRPLWGPDNISKGARIPDNIKIDYNGDKLNPKISFTEDLGTCIRCVILQGKEVFA